MKYLSLSVVVIITTLMVSLLLASCAGVNRDEGLGIGPVDSNAFNSATTIAIDASIDAEINPAGDEDYYRIEVSSATDLSFYTIGSTDTYGFLYDSDANQITFNDDNGVGTNFQISRRLSVGTYYLRIRHWNSGGTGSYRLHVRRL